jgi:RimJ/RimL family protein N-acetyltransferase
MTERITPSDFFRRDFELGPNTHVFFTHFDLLAEVYRQAYAGFPWYEGDTVTLDVSKERLLKVASMPNFQGFVVENLFDEPIAAELFHLATTEFLKSKSRDLESFASNLVSNESLNTIIWENEVFVKPEYQRNKIATLLRRALIKYFEGSVKGGTIILTRMRDDNIGTIKAAERVGFLRTGIRKLASQQPEGWNGQLHHEFWFKIVKPK